jgi:Fe-S oxidoreductase
MVDLGLGGRDGPFGISVTYHDPCFLGKQNHVFEEPRAILTAIPGVRLVEMDRSRERSLCCEGGGGRMWAEGTNLNERLAAQRVREAAETGAEVLAVACPFCLLTLDDAVKLQGLEGELRVMDIMELVDLALGDG